MCSKNVRNPFNPCGIMVPQILRNLNLNYRFRFLEKKIWTTLDFKKFLNGILNWSPPLVRVDSSPYPLDFLEQGRLPLSTESFHKRSYLVNQPFNLYKYFTILCKLCQLINKKNLLWIDRGSSSIRVRYTNKTPHPSYLYNIIMLCLVLVIG